MKPLLTTIFSLFLMVSLFGQETEEATVEYPVKGDSEIGVLFGLYTGYSSENGFSPADNTSYVHGLGFGINYDHYFSKIWSIRARLNYDPKGAHDEFTGLDLKMNFLSIPIMANWHFGKRKRWNLHFGPYVAFLLSADVDGTDVKDQLDSNEIGFDMGIGVKIPIGNMMFFIENDTQNDFSSPVEGGDNKLVRTTLTLGMIF